MRPRIKRTSIYHAEPVKTRCFMSKSERLQNKLRKGTITHEELMELAEFNVEFGKTHHEQSERVVIIWGKAIKLTPEEYKKYRSMSTI